jgi:hypothetical protein
MSVGLVDWGGVPGIGPKFESQENQVWWGHENLQIRDPLAIVASTATDVGNTPTSVLRAGLVMGKITASGKWGAYSVSATNGLEVALGVLSHAVQMLDPTGVAADRQGITILIGGLLKGGSLYGLDANARRQLSRRFIFDDDLLGVSGSSFAGGAFLREISKAADYTVVAADNLTEFVATAAAVFTLPAIGKGYRFKFRQTADANLTISSAEGENIVAFNNATADGIAFSTAGNKIGAGAIVYSNAAGDKWIYETIGAHTLTVVDA